MTDLQGIFRSISDVHHTKGTYGELKIKKIYDLCCYCLDGDRIARV
jgi:hypothetical protein